MIPKGGTKRKIFMVSAELFGLYSYPRVSMRDIAAKVGIRAASIYNHYTTKEEILEDLLTYYTNTVTQFMVDTEAKQTNSYPLPKLSDIVYVYKEDEVQLMYWVTRLLYTEQFTSPLAADALIGDSYSRYTKGYFRFFEILAEKGIIKNKENCRYYADLLARIGHSFQLDFVHPEFTPTISSMMEMMEFLLKLILSYEGTDEHLQALVK